MVLIESIYQNRVLQASIDNFVLFLLYAVLFVVLVVKMDLGEDDNNYENLAAEIYGITTLIECFMKLEFEYSRIGSDIYFINAICIYTLNLFN